MYADIVKGRIPGQPLLGPEQIWVAILAPCLPGVAIKTVNKNHVASYHVGGWWFVQCYQSKWAPLRLDISSCVGQIAAAADQGPTEERPGSRNTTATSRVE